MRRCTVKLVKYENMGKEGSKDIVFFKVKGESGVVTPKIKDRGDHLICWQDAEASHCK